MAQILDPLPANQSGRILCCYVNATSKVQIARISNIPNWYFERVVFPGQRLVFEAVHEAVLEIHSGMMASAILSDKIPCDRLMLHELEIPKDSNRSVKVEGFTLPKQATKVIKAPALTSVD
ncbi:MAG: DUF1830 domain-containing protein [Hormoscilla sp.]